MEAVIGAVYLDAGFEIARDVVLRLWENHINNAAHDARDSKTILQEWAQAKNYLHQSILKLVDLALIMRPYLQLK